MGRPRPLLQTISSPHVSRDELERFGDLNAKSMVAAKKALELNPNLATALHAMANSQRYRLEMGKCTGVLRKGIEARPGFNRYYGRLRIPAT